MDMSKIILILFIPAMVHPFIDYYFKLFEANNLWPVKDFPHDQ